jgi:D-serine dehydratase
MPMPFPPPFPPRGSRPPFGALGQSQQRYSRRSDDRVNVAALRELTDDSGGRTEIIREARDLDPATTAIADELSKQYYLGYGFTGKKDGRWHSIRVQTRNSNYRVRARRGYVAG